jgi:hypothetical protein
LTSSIIPVTHETAELSITGSTFETAPLKNGEFAFSNRGYKWAGIPESLSEMSFTRLPGGANPILEVTAKTGRAAQFVLRADE